MRRAAATSRYRIGGLQIRSHSSFTAFRAAAGLLLLGAYAIPLLAPPAPSLDATAGLLGRVFPGVPGIWIATRLAALAVGAALLASAAPPGFRPTRGIPAAAPLRLAPANRAGRSWEWIALVFAAGMLAQSLTAVRLSRSGELLFLASLFVPACLFLFAVPSSERNAWRGPPWISLALLLIGWVGLRAAISFHTPRAADLVDTWLGFEYLERAADPAVSLLRDRFLPGLSGLYLHLQGAAWFGSDGSFVALQIAAFCWLAATALGIARLANDWTSREGALVAAAVFLFSPFAMSLLLGPTPYYLGPGVGVFSLLLADAIVRRGSLAALVALAPLLGLIPMIPLAAPPALFAACRVARNIVRGQRFPVRATAVAVLAGLAAASVAVPGPTQLREMRSAYVDPHGSWSGIEDVLFGQSPPQRAEEAWHAPVPSALDVPLAGIVAPFAVARTPMRAWADSLLDPVGGALVALGIVLCVRALRSDPGGRALLLLLGVTLLPGLTSSFDRPSLTRSDAFLIPAALLAAVGAGALASVLAPARPRRVARAVIAAVALGGTWVFDSVGPRVLPQSYLSIAIEAATQRPDGGATILDYPAKYRLNWLFVAPIAAQVPKQPIASLPYEDASTLDRVNPPTGSTRALFWSPALEQEGSIARALCARYPDAEIYQLTGRTGRNRVWAARIGADAWEPALPPARVRTAQCREASRR